MEAAILQAFESIRCAFLDVFFGIFSFLAQTPVIGLVTAAVYWTVSKRAGEFMLVNVLSGAALNGGIKDAVRRPRPYLAGVVSPADVDNAFVTTDMGDSYSFPSGHSQNGGAFWLSGARALGRLWAWLAAGAVLLLVMLSRVYLGVHYPTDVLMGAALSVLGIFFWGWIYRRHYEKRLWVFFGISLALCFVLFYAVSPDTAKSLGMALGASAGLLLEEKYVRFEVPGPWRKKLLRALIGGAVLGCVYVITKTLMPAGLVPDFFRYAIVLFTATFCVPLFFRAFDI